MFVDDAGDNTVKRFDASNGAYLGTFVPPNSAGLTGPAGIIFSEGQLFVVNQNVNTPNLGEIFIFDGKTGAFVRKLIASTDRGAPFAPQGIVRGPTHERGERRDHEGSSDHGDSDDRFYVADVGTQGDTCDNQGDVKVYTGSGAFMRNLDRRGFRPAFYPRGVVFGPDGLLYVSARGCPISENPDDGLIGYILRFDPRTYRFIDVFASNQTVKTLHRPEGLVFDGDGILWVTSFRDNSDSTDIDRILKLEGKSGRLLATLELWAPGKPPRAYAQAILFGPGGKLFIPITGDDPATTGQIRRCAPKTLHCDVIVQAGTSLVSPWFLTFRNTDPATLEYEKR
ncbi:hypothetical protein [Paraburkholderia sp. 31.1]|uniref:hypothetical protein n=1 Tax=Paraburkholderia sp. 31.1 TaxID=2615205 RepID=UPI00223B033E|nr:hypothetical protein [Paraburkholderia sp. 31.1]